MYSLTRSLTHSFTHSLTHSLTITHTHSCVSQLHIARTFADTVRTYFLTDASTSVTISNSSSNNSSSSNSAGAVKASVKRQECVYVRYMRVGDIFVDVTTTGYPFNLTDLRAVVEVYCRFTRSLTHALTH